jgi:hypothetical protein
MQELEKIRGVGRILSRRFAEAGYDTFEKIAAAGEERIGNVPGVNRRMAGSIVAQAADFTKSRAVGKEAETDRLREQAASLRELVGKIVLQVRERLQEGDQDRSIAKIEKQFVKLMRSLAKVEASIGIKPGKAAKGLAGGEKKLAAVDGADPEKLRKSLKRTRKALKKAYS